MPLIRRFGFVVWLLAAAAHSACAAELIARPFFARLDRVSGIRSLPNGIEIRSGQALIEITALRDDLLRMRVGPIGQLPEDASWAVLPAARKASVSVHPQSNSATAGFTTAKLHVLVRRDPLEITITDLAGNVLSEDMPGRPIEFHGQGFRLYRNSPIDEHYFGLGDKPGPLDRRNQAFADWNTDSYGWQESSDPLYKSIPFFMAYRRGICTGIFLDNTWRTSFDFNKEYRDGYSLGSEGGPVDLYLMYGPSPKEVMSAWAWLTGPTPLPPLWALGYQQSRYSYGTEAEVRRIADQLRQERIPADAIYLDIDYQVQNRPFTVSSERFPHFADMIRDLRAKHMRTVLITDLHLAYTPLGGYPPFLNGARGDHFLRNADGSLYVGMVWPGKTVFPEFTQSGTREWWGSLYSEFTADGAAGFWNDMNEPAVFLTPSKTMPDDVRHRIEEPGFHPRTASHLEIHNAYGMLNSRATWDGLRRLRPEERPFVLTRASFAGGQRYAATWTGDNSSTWNHLRQTTPQLLNLGLSGFALSGADVGGYAGSPQPELLTRWMEAAAFQPLDRNHTDKASNPQEPWENGSAEDVNLRRKYIEERYRLLPYLYTTAEEMSRNGLPLMRPLFLEFPRAGADGLPLDLLNGNVFLLGPSLLVAQSPYPDMVDDFTLTLPEVGWYDYWNGQRVEGSAGKKPAENTGANQTILRIHRSLDTLPVFVRAGAMIPAQPLVQSTEEHPQGPLQLRVYPPVPGGGCEGTLYLDDGSTYAFEKGEYLRLGFSCHQTALGLAVTIEPHRGSFAPWWRQVSVEVYGATRPAAGASLAIHGAAAATVEAGFDDTHHRITVLAPDDGKGIEVNLAY